MENRLEEFKTYLFDKERSINTVDSYARSVGAYFKKYDEEAQAPFFTYTAPDGTEHIVWFENEQSWTARLALVEEYGLAGVSIWNIMNIFYGGI